MHTFAVLLIFTKYPLIIFFSFAGEFPVFFHACGCTLHRKYALFESLKWKTCILCLDLCYTGLSATLCNV